MSKTSKTYSQERRNYSMAERKDDLREGRKNDTHAMQNHANWKVLKNAAKSMQHVKWEARVPTCCKSHAKWQVSATKCCRGIEHVKGEKSVRHAAAVCHMKASKRHTHTEIRCFQLPRTRVKTPCPVDSRHFLRTSGTVSCKMLQIRYFSLNMASKSVQNTDSSSKCCNYDAVKRFKVQNAANTVQIGDSGSTMLPIPRK